MPSPWRPERRPRPPAAPMYGTPRTLSSFIVWSECTATTPGSACELRLPSRRDEDLDAVVGELVVAEHRAAEGRNRALQRVLLALELGLKRVRLGLPSFIVDCATATVTGSPASCTITTCRPPLEAADVHAELAGPAASTVRSGRFAVEPVEARISPASAGMRRHRRASGRMAGRGVDQTCPLPPCFSPNSCGSCLVLPAPADRRRRALRAMDGRSSTSLTVPTLFVNRASALLTIWARAVA